MLWWGIKIASAKQATRIFNLGVERYLLALQQLKTLTIISELAESVSIKALSLYWI